MISQSYYNKYRPKTFKDIKGSKSADILEIQIKNNRTTHAYIFAGPPGTGKTSSIVAIAKHYYGEDYHNMVLILNASEERGIETVRNRIKQFVISK